MDDSSDEPPPPVAGQFPAATSLEDNVASAIRYEQAARSKNYALNRSDAAYEDLIERTKRLERYSAITWGVVLGAYLGYQIVTNYDRLEPVFGALAQTLK